MIFILLSGCLSCIPQKGSDKQMNDLIVKTPAHVPDSSAGAVVFYFPDEESNDLTWNHPDGEPVLSDIPLYHPRESQPFDTLRFIKLNYTKDFSGFRFCGPCYFMDRISGLPLAPYRIEMGESSAMQAVYNRYYAGTDNSWVHCHEFPEPIYDVSFRLKGGWDEWLYLVLDEITGEGAYIRRDTTRMQLVDWSYYLSGVAIDMADYPVYDKPNGNILPTPSGGYIVSREEEWVEVSGYDADGNRQNYWLRWRDKNGILPKIRTFMPIE